MPLQISVIIKFVATAHGDREIVSRHKIDTKTIREKYRDILKG